MSIVGDHDVVREARDEVVEAARGWTHATCDGQPGFGLARSQECRGMDHQEHCSVTLWRKALFAAVARLDKLTGT